MPMPNDMPNDTIVWEKQDDYSERGIRIAMPWDTRGKHKDGSHNGMRLQFAFRLGRQATTFDVVLPVFLPETHEINDRLLKKLPDKIYETSLAVHSPDPIFSANDKPTTENCIFIDGPCFYDVGVTAAWDLLDRVWRYGLDEIWKELVSLWDRHFWRK
jgi:hypothetical protein